MGYCSSLIVAPLNSSRLSFFCCVEDIGRVTLGFDGKDTHEPPTAAPNRIAHVRLRRVRSADRLFPGQDGPQSGPYVCHPNANRCRESQQPHQGHQTDGRLQEVTVATPRATGFFFPEEDLP
jgi:hypothetical protein